MYHVTLPSILYWAIFLFIIYVNNFPKCLQHTTSGMFADDTYITVAHKDISTIECSLNSDLAAVHDWLQAIVMPSMSFFFFNFNKFYFNTKNI